MKVGVPREIKVQENRVGLTPASVSALTARGHSVLVETGAGFGVGATDRDYVAAGAAMAAHASEVFTKAELIIKVKEPLSSERAMLRPHHTLFTYLHLAADETLTRELAASGATAIAYEGVTAADGSRPLLAPMSEIAGRMSIQAAAGALETTRGGKGILLSGSVGVEPARVVILGGGVVGTNAASMALGLGADVAVLDQSMTVLRLLNSRFGDRLKTIHATPATTRAWVRRADVVVIGVYVPGVAAPKLVTAEDVEEMSSGSVIVDVAIDQGGGAETSRPTTHEEPTYVVDAVVHYCVANMPGAVARTSTNSLNSATLPFVLKLADLGTRRALEDDPHLAKGLSVQGGRLIAA